MQLTTPKSRWHESEWWLTIGTIVLGMLVKLGILDVSQSELAGDVMNDLVALIMVVGPVLGWQFTRTKKKIAERDQDAKVAEATITGKAKVKAVASVGNPPAPKRQPEPPVLS